ncbi:MAG TPA: 3-hydroxyacyl-CoA dehydrogenase NAD-binding domain-containing protein, partial [Burkholderiales bacterium]|nr:3-hydroxyacyl-CoA dehydrogenase NAD-binding domain-containing protein [Burkholderiales bacterium]
MRPSIPRIRALHSGGRYVPLPQRVAIIGAGLIGRAWAIVFARAGCDVTLYDANPEITR